MSEIADEIRAMIKRVHGIGPNPPTGRVGRCEVWRLLQRVLCAVDRLEDDAESGNAPARKYIDKAIEDLEFAKRSMQKSTTLMEDLAFMDTIPDE